MGSCICNSISYKENFSVTFEDPSLSITSQRVNNDLNPVFNSNLNLSQFEDLTVNSNIRIEIQKLPYLHRPMLKRSLTVSSPQLPQTASLNSSCRRIQRTKSNIGKRRNSFLSRAKEKMREIKKTRSKFNEKNESFSEETTEALSFTGFACIDELGNYRLRED
jgi:hypothetical protein